MAGLKPLLKDIADAIRAKSGTTAVIPASEFADKISKLYVVSNQVSDMGGIYLDAPGVVRANLNARIPSGAKITFDGKQLIVPIRMSLDYGYGYKTSNFNITVSFE